jgi:Chalcone isomerase-like
MNIHAHRFVHVLALAALLSCGLPVAAAAPGTELPPAARSWTRDTGVGDVTVSLHARQPLAQTADILSAGGDKQLRVVLQQRLSADQIGRLLLRDAEKHSPRGEFAAHAMHVLQIGEAFANRKDLAAGHSFGIQFVPGAGTRLLIDDQPASAFVAEPSFFALMLRPWLAGVSATDAAHVAQR